jgi:nicotinate-nucleotide adenylyltransferase
MKNIGIFGGTFNPPHRGHIVAVNEFVKAFKLDEMHIIPAGIPPHKDVAEQVSGEDRLFMARLAFPNYEVLNIEIKKEGKSYTAETIEQLKTENKNSNFYLLMGTDMFLTLQDWYKPDIIFKNCIVAPMERHQNELEKIEQHSEFLTQKFNAKIKALKLEPFEISSTEIREKIKKNEEIKGLVSEEVLEYIKLKGLYI